MYHPIRKCGVLTDFDLSIIAWRERVLGTDRTGTIPFMALDLLCKEYWAGKVTRRYHHELEAFIWMLPFVVLGYDNGKLDPKNQFIKDWITSDYLTCMKNKLAFIMGQALRDSVSSVGSAFQAHGMFMYDACYMVRRQREQRELEAHEVFVQGALPKGVWEHSAAMWDQFILFYLSGALTPPGCKSIGPFSIAHNAKIYSMK